MSDLFDKSQYFRGHLKDPFVGRPSGFGRPSCRTSELQRTFVVFRKSLYKARASSSPPMSDVRIVSDVRSSSVCLLLLEPELRLLHRVPVLPISDNQELLRGIKLRLSVPLERTPGSWEEELPSVLWSIWTTPN